MVAVATACSLLKATFLASDVSALRSIKTQPAGTDERTGAFARPDRTGEREGVRWKMCEQEDGEIKQR